MSNTLDVNALNPLQRHTLFCANINFLAKITCELYFEKTVYTTVGGAINRYSNMEFRASAYMLTYYSWIHNYS